MKGVNKNIGYICAAMLLLLIAFMPKEIIWDEAWYMACVNNLHAYGGLTVKFIRWSPAAPMHAIIHYIFSPVTHLQSPQIRILNYLICAAICVFIYKILKLNNPGANVTIAYSFMLFLLPSFFVLGFFALTEAPCLLLYVISIFFLSKYVLHDKNKLLNIFLCGLFLGFTILTRQVFLACLGPPCVLVFYKQFKNRFPAVVLFGIGAVLLVAPVIYIWQGLVPMSSGFRDQGAATISVKYVFLSYGYAFFYLLTILPQYMFQFIKKNWKIVAALAIIGLACSVFIQDNEFLPMAGLLRHRLSPSMMNIVSVVFFKFIGMICLIPPYFLLHELYINRKDFMQTFYILSMLAILITPARILDQFSSRYSMQIAPLLIIFAFTRIKPIDERMRFAINGVAIIINLIAVITFYYAL